jgi:hypothetical protein
VIQDFHIHPQKSSNKHSIAFTFFKTKDNSTTFNCSVEIDGSLPTQNFVTNDTVNEGYRKFIINIAEVTAINHIKISLIPNENANLVSFGLLSKGEWFKISLNGLKRK